MVPPSATQIVLAGVTTALGAAYLNAKISCTHDIREASYRRSFGKRLGRQLQKLGDEATIYRTLELAEGDAECLWFEGRVWTYKEVINEVDRIAWFLVSKGVKSGEFVAVFMTNSPEMVFAIYAIAKLGAVAALINSTLRLNTLSHCINLAKAALVISTPDLVNFALEINKSQGNVLECCCLSLGSFENTKWEDISQGIQRLDIDSLLKIPVPIPYTRPKRGPQDISVLIYTSGTTGKPKAVSIKNFLMILVSIPLSQDLSDAKRYFPMRVYSCLPLFHATCFFTGLAYSAGTSGTLCLARKFSASRTSRDLVESRATRMLYVGELCRYLLAAPPSEYDHAHNCIVAAGNGLQKDIWEKFQERYRIKEIREVYRSTEGIAKFDNFGKGSIGAGKVGLAGPLGRYLEDDTYLVRYDYTTEAPYRDPKTSFCVQAKLGEPGEAIGRVRSMAFYSEYLGNPTATNLKLIKDVFKKGDIFQRTGDLLLRDTNGWVRFHDRTGDTFRWKGENVSAGEVRGFISEMPNVADAVVFGVNLEGYDGQLGAAGICLDKDSDNGELACVNALYNSLKSRGLPNYALPRLVRFIEQVETGSTFKQAKDAVKNLTWKPPKDKADGNRLYWLDISTYRKLDDESWANIKLAKAKL